MLKTEVIKPLFFNYYTVLHLPMFTKSLTSVLFVWGNDVPLLNSSQLCVPW